jgi:hypothetical protein
MKRNALLTICLVACLCVAPPVLAGTGTDTGTWKASAGAFYSTGKYGYTTSTDIWSVPLSLGYDTGKWSFKLTAPYVSISGQSNVIPGVGKVNNGNPFGRGLGRVTGSGGGSGGTTPTTTRGTASGLGDVTAAATYQLFYDKQDRFGMDLGTRVKFGTADANKGLGTGANDYRVGLDAFKGMGQWTLFGGAGYNDFGSSKYIKLKNSVDANLGAGYRFDASNNIGAFYYYRQRISDNGSARKELTGYWNHHISKDWEVQMYALTGFSDGSPDWGAGATLKWDM